MARSSLKLGPRKIASFPGTTLCDSSIEPRPVRYRRQRLEAAASAGRFSNDTHQCQSATLVANDKDSAIELELDPTPATAVVDVTPSVSVCELGPSAVASALTSARAEVPWTCTSMSNCFWTSTCSWISTSLANWIANASRFVVISSSCCSHARTHL